MSGNIKEKLTKNSSIVGIKVKLDGEWKNVVGLLTKKEGHGLRQVI